ncbi:MAG: lyase family protein [Pseudomonadota bacterium]
MNGPSASDPAFATPTLLGDLLGDAEIARHLTASAEVAAMIDFEAALARVEARMVIIPAEAGPAISAALDGISLDPETLIGPTRSAGVAVPGLVKELRQMAGPYGSYIHWGATSQDVTDTGFVLRARTVLNIMEDRLRKLTAVLAEKAEAYADVPMAGRTRSQIATPTTFGLRIAGWRAPMTRCLDRLAELRPRIEMASLGGAAGTLSVLGDAGPAVADALAAELDLGAPAKPWHTERDGMVELGNWLAMVSGLLGRIGGDLILLGRSEAGEAQAGVGGGSSTMPHKSNPVLAEALVTLARLNAGHAGAMQHVLMHQEERDGPPWTTEWLLLPQMMVATGAGLRNALELAETVTPNPDRMSDAMDIGGGAIHAEALAFALAEHMPLADAQTIVKEAAKGTGALGNAVTAICAERGLPTVTIAAGDVSALAAAWIRRSLQT